MLKSMTAYGRGEVIAKEGHFTAELSSVNRKFFDLNLLMPREFICFDAEIRKWLATLISRGQVTLRVSFFSGELLPITVKPNISLAKQVKTSWEEIAVHLGIDESFQLKFLLNQPDMLVFDYSLEERENCLELLKQAIQAALKGFFAMKEAEGAALARDLLGRLEELKAEIDEINSLTGCTVSKYREKLTGRLQEVFPEAKEIDQRILHEIAIFAEKLDVSEEITRFNSHIEQFQEALKQEGALGKSLEFLLQEMFREINTLTAKSSNLSIIRLGLKVKNTLEKIREQIQNIE